MEKIKVVAYCRVSTDSKDQLNSLANQRSYFLSEVGKSETYELVKIYADEGISGTSWNKRGQFMQMLHDAGLDIDEFKGQLRISISSREPLYRRILVKDVSRFARNLNAVEILRCLSEKGVYTDFTTVNKSTEDPSDALVLNVLLLFAEQESRDKSEKVLFGHAQAAAKGVVKTSSRIFGYHYDSESNCLTIREDEAEIVRLIFQLYVEGIGMRRILQLLEQKGYRTRQGKPFVQTSINRILQNEKYMGVLVSNKFIAARVFTNQKYSKARPREEWSSKKSDKIQAIINEETFEAARLRRESKINYIKGKGVNKGISEYAGLLICGKCGGTYTRNIERKAGVRIFYNCRIKKTKGKSHCDNKNVDLIRIEQALNNLQENDFHMHLFGRRTYATTLLDKMKWNLIDKIDNQKQEEAAVYKQELVAVRDRMFRLNLLFINDKIELSKHDTHLAELKDEEQRLMSIVDDLTRTNDEIQQEIGLVEDMITALDDLEIKSDYTKHEVLDGIQRIVVLPTKPNLRVEFKIFEAVNSIVRRHKDLEIPNMAHMYD